MNKLEQGKLIDFMKSKCTMAEGVFMEPDDLVFEENVKMNCFYCGKYNNNWRCPPNLPEIDYKKMMGEFSHGMFVMLSYDIKDEAEYAAVRNDSNVVLHRLLLDLEKYMWNCNCATALSFIGGSCRLCKGGCGKEKCNNPYQSRSPLEAAGVNIIKSVKKYGIDIKFPTDKRLTRVGLLLWQETEE